MSIELFVYIIIAACMGTLVSWAFYKSRSAELVAQLSEAKAILAERSASHEREREHSQKTALNVIMFPYKEEHGEDGYFSDERRAEIGYKYQLFVAGVPCLEPHKVALEVLSKKQVHPERIEKALQSAISVIESLASKHPSFLAARSIPALEAVRQSLATGSAQQGAQADRPEKAGPAA